MCSVLLHGVIVLLFVVLCCVELSCAVLCCVVLRKVLISVVPFGSCNVVGSGVAGCVVWSCLFYLLCCVRVA